MVFGVAMALSVSTTSAEGLYCVALRSIPPAYRVEPSVPYEAYTIDSSVLNSRYCADPEGGEVVGCTYTRDEGKSWIIVIADSLTAEDHDCVLAYEKAHLPPNCWGDPKAEKPEGMALLDHLQRLGCGVEAPPPPAARSSG